MDAETVRRLRASPALRELTRKRSIFAWSLTVIMLLIYFSYVFTVAFAPDFLARPVVDGAATSLAIPIGIAVIVSAILLTGLYVWRANGEFDRLTRRILDEVR